MNLSQAKINSRNRFQASTIHAKQKHIPNGNGIHHGLGTNRLSLNRQTALSVNQLERIKQIGQELLTHRPVQYILGEAGLQE